MASEAEVILSRCSDEAFWTVAVTDRGQWPRWTRLTEKAGGEVVDKGPHWKRFRIPAEQLRIGLKRQVNLSDEQRAAIAERLARTRAAQG